jgi:hypothetical protein
MPSFLTKNQLGKVEAPIKEWCYKAMLFKVLNPQHFSSPQ